MILKIRHILEAIIVKILFAIFGALPIKTASAIGGFIGRALGTRLKITKVARNNINKSLPNLTDEQVDDTIKQMWDNLGRIIGEFPHMTRYKNDDFHKIIEVENGDIIKQAGESDKTTIFYAGHFANWEMIPKTIFEEGCPSVNLVYRKSNNPYLDKLILNVRSHYSSGGMPKGAVGARMIIKAIKKGDHIGMLVDQKQNDGIAVPFFGRDAMTAPAIANLALKYNCPLVPLQLQRVKGPKFKIKVHEPFTLEKTGDDEKDIYNGMCKINATLEDWIRDKPSQWFWVHNRWPKG